MKINVRHRYCVWLPALFLFACESSDLEQASVPIAPEATTAASLVEPEGDNALKPADTPEFLPTEFELLTVEPGEAVTTGGQEVVITGKGFVPGMVVLFDQSPALDLFVVHEQMAIMRTPPHPPGRVDVWMYHDDIDWGAPRILEDVFLYYAEVQIAEAHPARGSVDGGDALTITGTGFDDASRFFVGGHLAIDQSVVDENTIVGFTPPGMPGDASIHVVNMSGTFEAKGLFEYGEPPAFDSIAPLSCPPSGGLSVRIHGGGFSDDVAIFFGDDEADLLDRDPGQRWVEVLCPPGVPGATSDVSAANGWGMALAPDAFAWQDPAADPYVLTCQTYFPTVGGSSDTTTVTIVANGLQYPTSVTVGGQDAVIVSKNPDSHELVVNVPPGTEGAVPLVLSNAYSAVTCETLFEYEPSPPFSVEVVTPGSGAVEGGEAITVLGKGFADSPALFVGAMQATGVVRVSGTQIEAVTPPGTPGLANIRLVQSGMEVVQEQAYEYLGDSLKVDLVAPSMVARAGGTYLRVSGTNFTPDAVVSIGGAEAPLISFVSSSELHVRSPKLDVGTYDATVQTEAGSAFLPAAVTAFDPQSGYSGTWGGPIDETVNVTVRGTNKYGPVPGAFVLVDSDSGSRFGYTDENGQITFSEPGLYGAVSATATHPNFDAYSVLEYDATNITIYIRPKKLGSSTPPPTWPDAVLQGAVLGLGKYVLPPPGACAGLEIEETEHCMPCSDAAPCETDNFSCAQVGDQGTFCLESCTSPADCPAGYACGPAVGGTRCLPAPGEKIAKCMVSNSSPFAKEPAVPETGWVKPGGTYELLSGRLGDIAVVCFGGYRTEDGIFTPTVMGVRRHIFAEPAATMTGLDVSLNIPLKKTMRLRLMDPPTWPGGLHDPEVTISLDLGSDGAIPMTRTLISAGDHMWLAPRQVGKLQGDIYDASFFFYSGIRAVTPTKLPNAYSLISGVREASETRLPVYSNGKWELELSPIEDDLHGLWGPASDHLYAVGDEGTILLFSGNAWTYQSSGTQNDLRAVTGRSANDIWAVGEKGTVLRFEGESWNQVEAPLDDFSDVATATGQPVYVVGSTRVHRFEEGAWSLEGPAWLQGIRSLSLHETGQMAAVGSEGRLFIRSPEGVWTWVETPTTKGLRDVLHLGEEIIAVGDSGIVLRHETEGGATSVVPTGTDRTLFAVTATQDGEVIVVGDDGIVLHRKNDIWAVEVIDDYRSAAYDIFAPPDGSDVRVVGSTAFILGPFVHFPYVTAPVHDGALDTTKIAWTWDGGPESQVTRLMVYSDTGKLQWTFVVNGTEAEFDLPPLDALMGYEPLPTGKKRLEITRILNTNFDIDNYTSREWSIYRRDSWASNRSYFVMD